MLVLRARWALLGGLPGQVGLPLGLAHVLARPRTVVHRQLPIAQAEFPALAIHPSRTAFPVRSLLAVNFPTTRPAVRATSVRQWRASACRAGAELVVQCLARNHRRILPAPHE